MLVGEKSLEPWREGYFETAATTKRVPHHVVNLVLLEREEIVGYPMSSRAILSFENRRCGDPIALLPHFLTL